MPSDLPPDLVDKVRPFVRGKRVLYVSNREDKQLKQDLERKLGVRIKTWSCSDDPNIDCRRVRSGNYDVVVAATYFCGASAGRLLRAAAKEAGVPFVDAHKGRVSATAAGMVHGMRIDLNAPPPAPKPAKEPAPKPPPAPPPAASIDPADMPELPPNEDPTIPVLDGYQVTQVKSLKWDAGDLEEYLGNEEYHHGKVKMVDILRDALGIVVQPEPDGTIKWGRYAGITNKISAMLTEQGWKKTREQRGETRIIFWLSPEYQERNAPAPVPVAPEKTPDAKLRMPVSKALARNVYFLRRKKGWSQRELAERAGVSQTVVSRIERAFTSGKDFVRAVVAALGVTIQELQNDDVIPVRDTPDAEGTESETPEEQEEPEQEAAEHIHLGYVGPKSVHLSVQHVQGDLNELISLLTANGWKITIGA